MSNHHGSFIHPLLNSIDSLLHSFSIRLSFIPEFLIERPEESLRLLNSRSVELKRILGRIPDEIFDRKKFLETIKYALHPLITVDHLFSTRSFIKNRIIYKALDYLSSATCMASFSPAIFTQHAFPEGGRASWCAERSLRSLFIIY